MNLLSRQIDEISQKTELKFLVFIITLINLASAIQWSFSGDAGSDLPQMCWPIFNSCYGLPDFLTPYLLWALIACATTTLLLLLARSYKFAFGLMTLTFSIKLTVYLLNYSYSNNIQALVMMLELFLFFIPLKSSNLKFIILLFHVWDGFSKLNMNWLSGLELQSYLPHLHIKWIEWVAAMVVLIQFVVPFILLSRLKIAFTYAWITLALYHIAFASISGQIVYAYPALLVIYIAIYRFFEIKQQREQLYQSYLRPEPSKLWLFTSVVFFFCIQWVPGFSHPLPPLNQTPLTLQPLKMPSECFSRTFIHYKQSLLNLSSPLISSTGGDFKCHKSSHYNLDSLCKKYRNQESFVKLRKVFYSKDLTAEKYLKIFDLSEDCSFKKRRLQQ